MMIITLLRRKITIILYFISFIHIYYQQLDKHELEKLRYEEDNYMRLPVTKKDKIKEKIKMNKTNEGEKIDDFREFHNIRNVLKNQNVLKKNNMI